MSSSTTTTTTITTKDQYDVFKDLFTRYVELKKNENKPNATIYTENMRNLDAELDKFMLTDYRDFPIMINKYTMEDLYKLKSESNNTGSNTIWTTEKINNLINAIKIFSYRRPPSDAEENRIAIDYIPTFILMNNRDDVVSYKLIDKEKKEKCDKCLARVSSICPDEKTMCGSGSLYMSIENHNKILQLKTEDFNKEITSLKQAISGQGSCVAVGVGSEYILKNNCDELVKKENSKVCSDTYNYIPREKYVSEIQSKNKLLVEAENKLKNSTAKGWKIAGIVLLCLCIVLFMVLGFFVWKLFFKGSASTTTPPASSAASSAALVS